MKRSMGICVAVTALVLTILIAICVGCGRHLTKECEYRSVEHDCGCGVLKARLISTPVTRGKETVRGSPYQIFIWFHSPDGGGTVTLKKGELRDADRRDRVCAEMEEQIDSLDLVSIGGYAASFRLKGLDLKYIRYILSVQLVVEKGGKAEKMDIELPFEQDYRERWSNALWDAFMSV